MGFFKKNYGKPKILEESEFNKRTNALKRASNVKTRNKRLDSGLNDYIEVRATVYCKPTLRECPSLAVTLTQKNAFQKKRGWPDGEIINVNSYNAKETTASNFIGYLRRTDCPDLYKEVQANGRVHVKARVRMDQGVPRVYILAPK